MKKLSIIIKNYKTGIVTIHIFDRNNDFFYEETDTEYPNGMTIAALDNDADGFYEKEIVTYRNGSKKEFNMAKILGFERK